MGIYCNGSKTSRTGSCGVSSRPADTAKFDEDVQEEVDEGVVSASTDIWKSKCDLVATARINVLQSRPFT